MNTVSKAKGISAFGQLGILMGLFFLGIILASLATILIPVLMFHIPVMSVPAAITDPKNVQLGRLVQFAGTLFLFALPAFLFAKIAFGKPLLYLGFTTRANTRQFFLVLLLIIVALFSQSFITQLNEAIPISKSWEQYFKQLEDEYSKEVLSMAQMKTFGDYILSLIILAFLPAMFEEMFFRGALQQVLVAVFRNVFAGILLTSILFSLAHASYYGFLTRMFLGMLLGYIFYYSKNIWLNISAHFLNNAIVVTGLYLLSRSGKLTEKSMEDENYPVYVGVIAIVVVFALFVFFKRESIKTVAVTHDGIMEEYQLLQNDRNENNDVL